MAELAFGLCGCLRCEGRRIEHPPVTPGCPCPECQPGPGLADLEAQRLERVLGPVTKVITLDWCMSCRDIVRVKSVRSGPGWHNTCEHFHTWRSFD